MRVLRIIKQRNTCFVSETTLILIIKDRKSQCFFVYKASRFLLRLMVDPLAKQFQPDYLQRKSNKHEIM